MPDFDDLSDLAWDLTSAADTRWFKAHPDRKYRIRQALAGELPGVTADHMVAVRQDFPGVRFRAAFRCSSPLPPGDAPEWYARQCWEGCEGVAILEVDPDALPAPVRPKGQSVLAQNLKH
jgi:hypothetical protein